jgi:3-phosphoshikimate 1-carboxyvinyltransferase
MVLAAFSEGQSIFLNCDRLKIKESDRLDAMYQNLKKAGIQVEVTPYQTVIHGVKDIDGDVTLDGYHDHRIVMALSILSLKAKKPITITGSEAIKKSFPTFFEVLRSIGGMCDES